MSSFPLLFQVRIIDCPYIRTGGLSRAMKGAVPSGPLIRTGKQQLTVSVVHAQFDLSQIRAVNDPEQVIHAIPIRGKSIGEINGITLRRQIECKVHRSGVHHATVLIDQGEEIIPIIL